MWNEKHFSSYLKQIKVSKTKFSGRWKCNFNVINDRKMESMIQFKSNYKQYNDTLLRIYLYIKNYLFTGVF